MIFIIYEHLSKIIVIHVNWTFEGIPTGKCVNSSVRSGHRVCEVYIKNINLFQNSFKIFIFNTHRFMAGVPLSMTMIGIFRQISLCMINEFGYKS